MNNKGFTLIELLLVITLISVVMTISLVNIGDTFSVSNEKAYEIMKKSIITQVSNYIYECDNKLVNCENDYKWIEEEHTKRTSFNLSVMKKYAYFSEEEYINPITNEDISNCLIINVIKDEYSTLDIKLDDSKCEK